MKILSILGVITGGIIALLAQYWAKQSTNDPNIVGANIGAGVFGVAGIGLAIISLIVLLASLKKSN